MTSKKTLIWLVPILTTVHNLEEAAFMPMVLARRNSGIPIFLQSVLPPIACGQFLLALFTMTAIPYLISLFASREQEREGLGMFLLASVQFMMFVNVFAHVVLAVLMRGYSHGLITALVINLPFSIYFLYRAVTEKWLSGRALAYIIPTALLFHAVGIPLIIILSGRIVNMI
jgi:hypothetical protein